MAKQALVLSVTTEIFFPSSHRRHPARNHAHIPECYIDECSIDHALAQLYTSSVIITSADPATLLTPLKIASIFPDTIIHGFEIKDIGSNAYLMMPKANSSDTARPASLLQSL